MKILSLVYSVLFCMNIFSQQWIEQNSGTQNEILSIAAYNANDAWFDIGLYDLSKTTNGGDNWFIQPSTNYGQKLIVTEQNVLFRICTNLLNWSTTGGNSWLWVNITQHPIGDFQMLDSVTGFVISRGTGDRFDFYKTTSSGLFWDTTGMYVPNSGDVIPKCMFALDSYIWIGAEYYNIYYTSNNGVSWQSSYIPNMIGTQKRYIWFNSTSAGILAITNQIWYTTNGGASWAQSTQAFPGNINGITGYGGKFLVVSGSKIFSTTNNGLSWVEEYTAPSGTYTCLSKTLANDGIIWAGRTGGGLTKGINIIGIESIGNEVPLQYSLHQNYPNPFNPSTTIRFDISGESHTKITIFNILGDEVSILVNQKLKAGGYKVNWNAENYSNGIYFCRLETGKFTQTIKMMLIK
jgi:hypothetical protein